MAGIKTPAEIIQEVTKTKEALAEHTIVYDSATETLEPTYFFMVDLMNDFGLKPEKIIDNFVSSPGSGHFGEIGQRATIMQQQGAKILGDVNTVLRSVLNVVYDLKEFKIRLQHYENLGLKDKGQIEAAMLALKQIWMDKVDIVKGNSSIKAMALGQAGFQTLLDAFLVVKDPESPEKLDLNERVKRIVKQRIAEFNIWVKESEKELRKRYEMERNYLKSQVNSLKLYIRWVKPYLKAAQQLEMTEAGRKPDLVKTFNTIILELSLFGKTEIDVVKAVDEGNLPINFKLEKIKKKYRKYYSCILIDFNFRGIPRKISQKVEYVYGGKTEINFKAYIMREDEYKKFQEELDKSNIEDGFKLIEGATTESLSQLQEEINSFLEEKELEKKEEEKKKREISPFLALIGKYGEEPEKPAKKGEEKILPENRIEKDYIKPIAKEEAKNLLFQLFDIYKKAHGMVSYT